jgi:hypothetical protein
LNPWGWHKLGIEHGFTGYMLDMCTDTNKCIPDRIAHKCYRATLWVAGTVAMVATSWVLSTASQRTCRTCALAQTYAFVDTQCHRVCIANSVRCLLRPLPFTTTQNARKPAEPRGSHGHPRPTQVCSSHQRDLWAHGEFQHTLCVQRHPV